ncbi:MAG: hypothetical protein AMJ54_13800 [Deltaproteobacteria bacterium SG8_13]|nr:MAG: hypothetical protein AMJ54_13800 [Deltaproteobacteria bacterium SG8_13]
MGDGPLFGYVHLAVEILIGRAERDQFLVHLSGADGKGRPAQFTHLIERRNGLRFAGFVEGQPNVLFQAGEARLFQAVAGEKHGPDTAAGVVFDFIDDRGYRRIGEIVQKEELVEGGIPHTAQRCVRQCAAGGICQQLHGLDSRQHGTAFETMIEQIRMQGNF